MSIKKLRPADKPPPQRPARRIAQGAASGEPTPRETIRLERQQAGVERAQRRMEADGRVTPGERARLYLRRDEASRDIYRAKRNDRKDR